MEFSDILRQKVNYAPESSGVYLWKNGKNDILYIGKAKNLRNRIRQYLHSKDVKTRFLMEKVHDVDWIATFNEAEALILENNLIKKHYPIYNIRLKDDKKYPYICISTGEKFPRVFLTRKNRNPSHLYYGPYVDVRAARNIIDLIQRIYPIRKRNLKLPLKTLQRPCINYHIGLCWAPCTGRVDEKDYRKLIDSIIHFMEGKNESLVKELKSEMIKYSNKMEYEKAARIRNLLADIEQLQIRQDMEDSSNEDDYDIIGIYTCNKKRLKEDYDIEDYYLEHIESDYIFTQVSLLRIRSGKLVHKGVFAMTEHRYQGIDQESIYYEIMDAFIRDFYLNNAEIPGRIILGFSVKKKSHWENLIQKTKNKVIHIDLYTDIERDLSPYRLTLLANKNAALSLKERILSEKIRNQRLGLLQIQKMLDLKNLPEIIECYDISNFQGKEATASGIMLKDGIPHKNGYRKYRIQMKNEPNDPAMIYETLSRRFRKLKLEKTITPNLIVIDGGITQLKAALRAREENSIQIPLISLAKKKEEIYTEHGEILDPDSNSPGMLVLRLARDEAHRFAVAYHRNLRMKRNLKSMFKDIPGMGEKRIRELQVWLRGRNVSDLENKELLKILLEEFSWMKNLTKESQLMIEKKIKDNL